MPSAIQFQGQHNKACLAFSPQDSGGEVEIFGEYLETLPPCQEQLTLDFSPSSAPPRKRWENNGRSADFIADFLMTCLPDTTDVVEQKRQSEIKDAVSYIANELLENAMKYSDKTHTTCTRINLYFSFDKILFLITNGVHTESINFFKLRIQELLNSNPHELYIERLEQSAESEGVTSGLGLLTMLTDYAAKLGWKFESSLKEQKPLVTVTTMVQLEI